MDIMQPVIDKHTGSVDILDILDILPNISVCHKIKHGVWYLIGIIIEMDIFE